MGANSSAVNSHAVPGQMRGIDAPAALPRALRQILCLDDFQRAAARRLPRPVYAFVASGAEDETSLRGNRAAYAEYGFVTRVLRDVSTRSQATSLFGQQFAAPFGIAPLGLCALSAYRGDLVLARAAGAARIPMVLSGSSLIRMEEVASEGTGAWFQAYLPGDETRTVALVERVQRAGFRTLVVTLDTPVSANRENNVRAGFSIPLRPNLRLAWDGKSCNSPIQSMTAVWNSAPRCNCSWRGVIPRLPGSPISAWCRWRRKRAEAQNSMPFGLKTPS